MGKDLVREMILQKYNDLVTKVSTHEKSHGRADEFFHNESIKMFSEPDRMHSQYLDMFLAEAIRVANNTINKMMAANPQLLADFNDLDSASIAFGAYASQGKLTTEMEQRRSIIAKKCADQVVAAVNTAIVQRVKDLSEIFDKNFDLLKIDAKNSVTLRKELEKVGLEKFTQDELSSMYAGLDGVDYKCWDIGESIKYDKDILSSKFSPEQIRNPKNNVYGTYGDAVVKYIIDHRFCIPTDTRAQDPAIAQLLAKQPDAPVYTSVAAAQAKSR